MEVSSSTSPSDYGSHVDKLPSEHECHSDPVKLTSEVSNLTFLPRTISNKCFHSFSVLSCCIVVYIIIFWGFQDQDSHSYASDNSPATINSPSDFETLPWVS